MPAQHCTPPGQGWAAEHVVGVAVATGVAIGVAVAAGVAVAVGTVSLNAGTQYSATDFALSTAAPKFVLFTDTVCAANFAPLGSFAW